MNSAFLKTLRLVAVMPIIALSMVVGLKGASAPVSVAGMVYREGGGIASLRSFWEHTIILGTDGRYIFVKAIIGSTIDGKLNFRSPYYDGTYTYTKVSDSVATLTLTDPNASIAYEMRTNLSSLTLTLDFTTSSPIMGGDSGSGIVRAFERDSTGVFSLTKRSTSGQQNLANISMRGVASNGRPLIVGFNIPGEEMCEVLIRAVGPSLTQFGVAGAWSNPSFRFFRWDGHEFSGEAFYDDWSSTPAAVFAFTKAFGLVGAFPLDSGSRDAAGISRRLYPGSYTIVCAPTIGDAGGEVLVEVYVLR